MTKLIKLLYILCSCKRVVEKSGVRKKSPRKKVPLEGSEVGLGLG